MANKGNVIMYKDFTYDLRELEAKHGNASVFFYEQVGIIDLDKVQLDHGKEIFDKYYCWFAWILKK